MTKLTTLVLSAAIAMLSALPSTDALAQQTNTRSSTSPPLFKQLKITSAERKAQQEAFNKKYPKLANVLTRKVKKQTLPSVKRVIPNNQLRTSKPMKNIMRTADGRELWGNVIYQNTWDYFDSPYGMYSFSATSPISLTALGTHEAMEAKGGGAFFDGKFHFINYTQDYNDVFAYHYVFDAETWEPILIGERVNDLSLIAKETATNNNTGTVYGQFYTADLRSVEIGIINYHDMTRTTIGPSSIDYVALGVTSDNVLYGVAVDGYLYKIDTSTGEETLVGNTGVTVSDDYGQVFNQTGEIDQQTNTFYWAAIDAEGVSALYTVDLQTGAATKISDFSNEEQILALSIPPSPIADGAPAAVTNLTAGFALGDPEGLVSFRTPSKTYSGADLTGDVTYELTINGTLAKTEKVSANAMIRAFITAPEGMCNFVVTCYNDEGRGDKASVQAYVGFDTPKPVTDLSLNLNNETGEAVLSWTAPAGGVNGGYIGTPTYRVTRYPDNVVVADNLTGTSFTETLPRDEMRVYYYGVTAIVNDKESTEVQSGKSVIGDAIVPPYSESFDNASSMDLFTIIDANQDGSTWQYNDDFNLARYTFSATNQGDDWLITPPIKLQPGRLYKLSFKASGYLGSYTERIEVKYGNANTAEAMTNELLPPTEINATTYEALEFVRELSVETEQIVYIGFHSISDADMYYLQVDDIKISEGSPDNVPDVVKNITITPDPNGAEKAIIEFTAPTNAANGAELESLTKVELLRNKELIKAFTNIIPGEMIYYEDNSPVNGMNTYTLTAYNAEGEGRSVSETVYVGVDVPMPPTESKLTDQTTSIKIDWEPVPNVGANGRLVVPEDVEYTVYNVVQSSFGSYAEELDKTKNTTYTIDIATNEGDQSFVQYALSATNKAGKSLTVGTPSIVVGAPYTLPFRESFAGGTLTGGIWWLDYTGESLFAVSSSASKDGDGGCAVYTSVSESDAAYINSGKISLEGSLSPAIIFSHRAENKGNAKLSVEVQSPDGTAESVFTYDYATAEGEENTDWTTSTIKLDQKFQSHPYVIIKFKAEGAPEGAKLYLDDINVRTLLANDLAVSMDAPASVMKGTAATVSVRVDNTGENAAGSYTVSLFAGDDEIASVNSDEALAPSTGKTFRMEYTPSLFSDATAATLKAEVLFDGDMNPDDNTATASVNIATPAFEMPTSVTVKAETENTAELEWTAPVVVSSTVTEDFENYEAWSIDNVGEWTMVDIDQAPCTGLFQSISYPHQGEPFAYIVFNPGKLGETVLQSAPEMAAHSGEQYLAAILGGDENYNTYDLDNWLISPELTGEEQTVSFWVSNMNLSYLECPETFDILYSTTGTETTDFVKLGESHVASSGEWEQVSFTLPAGARYFAIRQTTNGDDSFLFKLDDITYTRGSGEVKGYNIYRDGQKVGSVTAESTKYTDTNVPEGTYTYAVTALYAAGESMPAKAEPAIITGIGVIEAVPGMTYDVYTVDGKCIGLGMKELKKLKPGVYVINNKKVTVK